MFKIFKVAFSAVIAATFVFGGAATTAAAETPNTANTEQSPVIDTADMFTPEQEATIFSTMESNFVAHDIAFVIETIPSLNGATIESVSLAEANRLGVGEAEKNNGVFILLSRDDREIRFELGTGVTGTVSDAEAKQVIDGVAIPSFKEGDYVTGVINSMNTLGSYYVGDINYVEPVVEPFDWSGIQFVGWVLLGVLILAGLTVGAVFFIKFLLARKAFNTEVARQVARDKLDNERYIMVNKMHKKLRGTNFELLPDGYDRNNFMKAIPELKAQMDVDPEYKYMVRIVDSICSEFNGHLIHGIPSMSIKEARQEVADVQERQARAKREKQRVADAERAETARRTAAARKLWDAMPKSEKESFRNLRGAKARINALPTNVATSGYENSFLYPYLMMTYFTNISASPSSTNSIIGEENATASAARSAAEAARSAAQSAAQAESHRARSSSSHSSSSSSYDYGSSSSFGGGSFDGGGSSGSW